MKDWIMEQKSKADKAWAAANASADCAATAVKHARDTTAARWDCQAAIQEGLFDQARIAAEKAWLAAGLAAEAARNSAEARGTAEHHSAYDAGRCAEASSDSASMAADFAWADARRALELLLEAQAEKKA